MPQHLTDVACFEWVRHRKVALAPETTSGVEIHLASCEACRKKIADFEALERSFHPYGAAMPPPRSLRIGSALKLIGLLVVVAAAVWGLVVLVR